MKLYNKLIVFGLIVILMLIHRYLFSTKEGFFDDSSSYKKLKQRLIHDLTPYCKISSFIQQKVQQGVEQSTKTSGTETNSSDQLAKIYNDMYSCKDVLASSRPTCSTPNTTMEYTSCDTYMKLPDFTKDGSCEVALMNITDDLPERIQREYEWFDITVKKLQEAVSMAQDPSTAKPPSDEQMKRYQKFSEGFQGKCSPEALKARLAQKNANSSCTVPSLSSEITRVDTLLDSKVLKDAISKMDNLTKTVSKLEKDMDDIKNKWGDAPKKSYAKFEGGDRTDSFIFSLKQNH